MTERTTGTRTERASDRVKLRDYHAAVWSEPVVMEMGRPGRRGIAIPQAEDELRRIVGDARQLVPEGMRRIEPPRLPELSQPEVLRHYLHLSQQTLSMMGINLFGTCTMKYNPRVAEQAAMTPKMAELHPCQHEETLQGILEIIHRFDHMCRALSGMDQFVFQPGGGSHAAFTHACVMRAYHAARGELEQRNEVITTLFTHCCNPAVAATAGFKVINLMPEENGYPSLEALKAAVSERTAGLMTVCPNDLGIYNPHIDEWVKVVHDAGGLCFYDHANFNGVMGLTRARDIGFDACMYMLHKTFGASKGGMGPAAGAYGCTSELAPYLPVPVVTHDGGAYHLDYDRPDSIGKVREFWGNAQVVLKAYAWVLAMGADGIHEARDLSVLGNNYLETLLMAIKGVSKGFPNMTKRRLEMTRYGWDELTQQTGVDTVDIQHRMTDWGLDAYWMAHPPPLVPEPFTPETGETPPVEDIEYWAAVLEHVAGEAYADPEVVKTSPHRQAVHRVDFEALQDPARRAVTWRAHMKKRDAKG